MDDKQQISWFEIEKRYLHGETPSQIAKDFPISAQQIQRRASYEKWRDKRKRLKDLVEPMVFQEIREFQHLSLQLAILKLRWAMENIKSAATDALVKLAMSKGLDSWKSEGLKSKLEETSEMIHIEGYNPEQI